MSRTVRRSSGERTPELAGKCRSAARHSPQLSGKCRSAGHTPELAGKWQLTALTDAFGDLLQEQEDPAEELKRLHKTTRLNRFYIPISQLPPLRPDPRKTFGEKAPSCYPKPCTSRAQRLMDRWRSMPTLRPQLPLEGLAEEGEPVPGPPEGQVARTVQRARQTREERRSKFCEVHYLTADGHQFPHIPCTCCDHSSTWSRSRRSSAQASSQGTSLQASARPATQPTWPKPASQATARPASQPAAQQPPEGWLEQPPEVPVARRLLEPEDALVNSLVTGALGDDGAMP